MQLQTAVVGAGVVSDIHMSALEQCPHTELVAICDVDEQKLRTASQKYDIRAVRDIGRLLDTADLDWLHICTPVQTHLEIAERAIEAGVAVNIEKPVTETVAEAEELVRLSEQHDVPVSVTHQHRFDPAMREAMDRIESGELGDIRGLDLLYTGETPPDMANRGEWAFELVGGEFEEGIPHPIYIMLGAAGYPESREAIQAQTDLYGDYERPFGYDGFDVSYKTETGVLCNIKCLAGSAPQRILFVHGEEKSLNVDFISQTVIEVEQNFNGSSLAKVRNNVSRAGDRLVGTARNAYKVSRRQTDNSWEQTTKLDSHAHQIDLEARALLNDSELPVPVDEGKWTIALVEAIRNESAQRERVVADGGEGDS